ncbi:DUF4062 domain-containing protein [Aquitalea denitrificans]|uniref:DUF4062 domain-containing protein n=1 Tax=Aquitalea denitrificans TaxID=519081 RepID=UPI001357B115|nr:DUF4062 domain-containing protein [Aquitalea denitrificans]
MKATKYQVFLSSTYSDLVDEREGIIKAVLEMYNIPIGMEMFSAEDEDQWEIIRRTIEVSDYYILVLGLRYGTKTSDGISFTQKEYQYALEKKIPILAFVMNDTVPLSKEKRDDDLSEICKFREMVLTNSKMAQFWETKDQLVKSVSISLMKQIMQKPGIGWVRGSNAGNEEALSNELTALSKENRDLRDRLMELESKLSLKSPIIDVMVKPPAFDGALSSYVPVEMVVPIGPEDVDLFLRDYVSGDDLELYNNSIPEQDELDRYNSECERIFKIKNNSMPLVIKVSNVGTSKANNLYVDVVFSPGIFVFDGNKEFSMPVSPIPKNPLERARAKYYGARVGGLDLYDKKRQGILDNLFNARSAISPSASIIPKMPKINRDWDMWLDGGKVTIKMDELLHTRSKIFSDRYKMCFLFSGKHSVIIKIICEEYGEVESKFVEFEV